MKKSKRWVLLFLAACLLAMAAYGAVNYYVNPLGYFTNARGLSWYYSDDFVRSIFLNPRHSAHPGFHTFSADPAAEQPQIIRPRKTLRI